MDKLIMLAFGVSLVGIYLGLGSRFYVRLAVATGLFLCWACVYPNMRHNAEYRIAEYATSFMRHISELLKADKYEDASKKLEAFNSKFPTLVTDEAEMRRFIDNITKTVP